jgi:hypothetical protein
MLVSLAVVILAVESVRHHRPQEAALLAAVLAAGALAARWLARDLRAQPANFPDPTPHGLRMAVTGTGGRRRSGP